MDMMRRIAAAERERGIKFGITTGITATGNYGDSALN
jgi:hypothetical protein